MLKITHLAPSLTRSSHLLVVLFHTVTSYLDTNTDSACYNQTFLQSIKSEFMFTYNFGYFLRKQCRDLINECVCLKLKETRVIKDFTPKSQKWENRGLKKILGTKQSEKNFSHVKVYVSLLSLKVRHLHLENYF